MTRYVTLFLSLLVWAFTAFASPVTKPTIIFMHAFKPGDFLEKKLIALVEQYNATPTAKGHVTLVAGGDYTQSFKRLVSGEIRPHLAMVSEYNSVTMFASPHLYVPVSDILNIEKIHFLPVIREFYSVNGKMVSYPFNCSAPALYYNKEAFKKAGLPDSAPKTWEEIMSCCEKLHAAGMGGFTFAWPAAYALEHFSSIHNIPLASHQNGFKNPTAARLRLNDPRFVTQLSFLQHAAQQGSFLYGGDRAEDAEKLFLEGKVAILMQGASRHGLLESKKPPFSIGVGPYPYKASLVEKPYAVNIGGTSLWVLKEQAKDQDQVADFLYYLSSPKIQAQWHQETAYLPVTYDAFLLTLHSGFYETHPAALVAVNQITRFPRHLPNGLRLANYGDRREKIVALLTRIFAERKPVKSEIQAFCKDDNAS